MVVLEKPRYLIKEGRKTRKIFLKPGAYLIIREIKNLGFLVFTDPTKSSKQKTIITYAEDTLS